MMQLSIDIAPQVPRSAYDYGLRRSGEAHGVVLTRRPVVELMLDLAGYTSDRDLTRLALLDPACGTGAFLLSAVERLVDAANRQGHTLTDLTHALCAFDIDAEHVAVTRSAVTALLTARGLAPDDATRLAKAWVHLGDFLLAPLSQCFDVVVGNPPYVRIEQIAPVLQAEYRRRYSTLFDRADLYVAFFERGLRLLSQHGTLCFVCADRWVLNRYGAPLRALIHASFGVRVYLDLHDASPFEEEVIAYPSIIAIGPGPSEAVHVGRLSSASAEACAAVASAWRALPVPSPLLAKHHAWFSNDAPWVLSAPNQRACLQDLESRFAPLEADGATSVGIGVATGCDHAFVVPRDADIEADRLVPLVMRADLQNGRIVDAGRCVINPFRDEGGLVDLRDYPRLARHLERHRAAIANRHVARKQPTAWYRTIDRIFPALRVAPKLLIPDIAGANTVVYDAGHYYAHHNLYTVTSSTWDVEVLGALLASRVALFFVWSYAVKMRGGYLRFQAQYLRRIRLPSPTSLAPSLCDALREAFRNRDFQTLDALALEAWQLDALPPFDFADTRR